MTDNSFLAIFCETRVLRTPPHPVRSECTKLDITSRLGKNSIKNVSSKGFLVLGSVTSISVFQQKQIKGVKRLSWSCWALENDQDCSSDALISKANHDHLEFTILTKVIGWCEQILEESASHPTSPFFLEWGVPQVWEATWCTHFWQASVRWGAKHSHLAGIRKNENSPSTGLGYHIFLYHSNVLNKFQAT